MRNPFGLQTPSDIEAVIGSATACLEQDKSEGRTDRLIYLRNLLRRAREASHVRG